MSGLRAEALVTCRPWFSLLFFLLNYWLVLTGVGRMGSGILLVDDAIPSKEDARRAHSYSYCPPFLTIPPNSEYSTALFNVGTTSFSTFVPPLLSAETLHVMSSDTIHGH